ncbi:MAG: asparagine synthase (glutamine-hydrolyzing) [Planctomycetota bacterium]|jgi:asparagine synthase (glutamine-hydrolysing)
MCGIAGFVDFQGQTSPEVLSAMTDALIHRGPDARGEQEFRFAESLVGLGHRRLSILDLSDAGRQPMSRGNLSIVFNGEVYNFAEIAKELSALGHVFKSHSDTEVILASVQQWGIRLAVKKFNGMFAIALVDTAAKKLYLVRDRVGVKPLYVYRSGSILLFASELKAFHEHPAFSKDVCPRATTNYFRFGYVPPSHCIYRNARQIAPAEILQLDLTNGNEVSDRYWHPEELFASDKLAIDYDQGVELLTEGMRKAFEYRMVSDVEVGVFLSGGYDSTAVAALLQSKPGRSLQTFTIGFQNAAYDESQYAKAIARHIGSNHREFLCNEKAAQQIIPQLPEIFDEPFGDSSAIPTILVSRLAREHVKVALSADGGDELFGGYNRYAFWRDLEETARRIPGVMSQMVPSSWVGSSWARKIPGARTVEFVKNYYDSQTSLATKVARLVHVGSEQYVRGLLGKNHDPWLDLSINCGLPEFDSGGDGVRQMMQMDYLHYLPGDILTKVDRATMSVSLEGREPLLDYRLAELAFQMPMDWKIQGSKRKRILKDATERLVPRSLLDRPKKGFSVPYSQWLRGGMRNLLEENLSESSIKRHGILSHKQVFETKQRFLGGDKKTDVSVWNLLMFQLWCDRWL